MPPTSVMVATVIAVLVELLELIATIDVREKSEQAKYIIKN